ncbi:hypothetical protein QCA50_007868 [Cerrena zonata]|uniref:Uncharacterized protein n=1 Tax=Cerrena zonata TaxID=2478898 RepID=A0AAW0GCA4_9APHY
MQQIWLLLLNKEFMHAYEHGIIILCGDGIRRRVFPRFLVYSADYPEKCLVACIKQLAMCCCMRCYCKKSKISSLGMIRDMKTRILKIRIDSVAIQQKIEFTRRLIFEKGFGVRSAAVKRMLDPISITPIRSAFSIQLAKFGVNHYVLFAPDFLHEWELGVWKAVFIHILRLLVALGNDAIQEFDKRFRATPTFGSDIIRRFCSNVSSQKRIAARDYEDLLQCILPVLEGIFPKRQNEMLADLVYTMAYWHSHAKLRLHTESTLNEFEEISKQVGQLLRKFEKGMCRKYITKELPREINARGCRAANLASKGQVQTSRRQVREARTVKFSFNTYKAHSLPDYPNTIRRLGTTDNYSTQSGELEHKRPKGFYAKTSRKNFVVQIAKYERRQRLLHSIGERIAAKYPAMVTRPEKRRKITHNNRGAKSTLKVGFNEIEPLPASSINDRYHISADQRLHIDITNLITSNREDMAFKDFYQDLQGHILSRLTGRDYDGEDFDFSLAERASIRIEQNRLYKHKVVRVHYTSYDMLRSTDSINPRVPDHANILLHGSEGEFWYARVIGIFHVNVRLDSEEEYRRMDILWVRWYGEDKNWVHGPSVKRLPRLGFIPHDQPAPFGFVDPADVVRAAHLIPAFAHGKTDCYLPPSQAARSPSENDKDWTYQYVNIFVDRDTFMRHRGGGVGHQVIKDVETLGVVEEVEEEVEEQVEEDAPSDDEDLENEIIMYGYEEDDEYDDEDEDEHAEYFGDGADIAIQFDEVNRADDEEAEERETELGPEDGEYEDEHDGYFGYAPL